MALLGQSCHAATSAMTTRTTTAARRRAICVRVGRRSVDLLMIGGRFCTARVYPWALAVIVRSNARLRSRIAAALGEAATLSSWSASLAR